MRHIIIHTELQNKVALDHELSNIKLFLASKEADDIAWFCKACKEPAKKAIIEDKCIED